MPRKNEFTKTIIRTLVLAAFILAGLFINVLAQERKTFSEEDLATLKKNAYEKLKGKIYRLITTTEDFVSEGDENNRFRKTTFETVPPDRRHLITETKTPEGVSREEWIYIGEKTFYKKGDEDWQDTSGISEGRGGGQGSGSGVVPIKTEYNFAQWQMVNGQETDFYEIITTYRYKSDYSDHPNINKDRYWFNKDGLFVKTEYESTRNNSKSFFRTTEYEYDPNIRIEAPVVKEKEKP